MSVWLLALLDDISMLADDAATMTKVSMQKTAWILWDDLAVNAKQASWYHASREIPVLIKITKGALKNKIIILPFAFLLTYFAKFLIPIILVFGWAYLAFEWAEKTYEFILERFFKIKHNNEKQEIVMDEDEKVKSAIFTDFILSIEIVVIALSSVLDYTLAIQIIVVTIVAILATFWVYGIVALIVRLDDIWFYLQKKKSKISKKLGGILIKSLPVIIKILSVVGTWAMLLVAGWIFRHNISIIHHFYEWVNYIPSIIFDTILWFISWIILVFVFMIWRKILKK